MRRVTAYMITWATFIGAAVALRFTYFRGTSSDDRLPLAICSMLGTALLFMAATLYESRRLALLTGFRGRGTFGYLRGWVKSVFVEVAANDDAVPPQAYREYRAFRLLSAYAFASLVLVVPVLVF